MRVAHRVAQVRAAEAALMTGLPDGALMQRAATALAVAWLLTNAGLDHSTRRPPCDERS